MNSLKNAFILINLGLFLSFVFYNFIQKEDLLKNGRLVLLKLAPVDPRSLMQGDYMELRYEIGTLNENEKLLKRGFCIVKLDQDGIAQKVRLQHTRTPLLQDELAINYTENDQRIYLGAESFFFQEGSASLYENAKYGGLKIDDKGHTLLTGLYDESCNLITP